LRATVSAVLAERQFHPGTSPLSRVVNWLRSHLHLPSLRLPGFFGGAWQSYAVLVVLVAAVVTAFVVAARRGLLRRLRHPAASAGVTVTIGSEALSPAQWQERAERLTAEGRFRDALRCRYCALVGELAHRGLLPAAPGRTSGDYERLVKAELPGAAPHFTRSTALFEDCWYGQGPSGADEQVVFDQAAQVVMREVGPP
jgi:hypothetical protein